MICKNYIKSGAMKYVFKLYSEEELNNLIKNDSHFIYNYLLYAGSPHSLTREELDEHWTTRDIINIDTAKEAKILLLNISF